MLSVLHINSVNSQNTPHRIQKKNYNSSPFLKSVNVVDNKQLFADTVSFSAKKQDNSNSIKRMITAAKQRTSYPSVFADVEIEEIFSKVTPKNQPFLKDILALNNKKLSAQGVIKLLDYVNQGDTDVDEFAEKIDAFKNLKNIVSGYGFKQSPLSEHFDKIPQQGIIDILTSDVLLREPKHNFNPLPEAYNNVVKVFESLWNKTKPSPNAKPDDYAIKDFMSKNFASMLVLGMVFDSSVFNELVFNRGKYINTIYMPRLRTLNSQDLEFLRKIQTDAVTEKENKSGDLAVYEISLDDKIATLNHLWANREVINSGHEGIDFNNYVKPVNTFNTSGNFKIDFQHLKIDLMGKVLARIGVDKSIVDKYMKSFIQTYEFERDLMHFRHKFWDINYVHLINAPENSLLRDIIIAATEGNFRKMLFEEGPIAETNRKNREAFEKAGLNYDNWIEPTIAPIKQKFITKNGAKEKVFFVRNWRRNPQESLFDGNYTTCCTGIDKDQGSSFPVFLTNTCTTTLEVRTDKNKVIAMSRIFMAKINGKLSMVVENIEVNNKMAKHYLYNDETKYKFREMIFDYARNFAKDINNTDKEIPVYFSSKYYKVKDIEKGLKSGKRYENVELIGEFPDKIYINSYGGRLDKTKLQYADDGDEFALHLSDITKRPKPVYQQTNEEESDSNYNYADKERNWQ